MKSSKLIIFYYNNIIYNYFERNDEIQKKIQYYIV